MCQNASIVWIDQCQKSQIRKKSNDVLKETMNRFPLEYFNYRDIETE